MTDDNIRKNIVEELRRGDECLAAAEHLLSGEFNNDAVSRAYYGAFHYARALLMTKGLEAKSQRGLIQLLSLHFVKDGPMPEKTASLLAQLATYRELSDYNAFTSFTSLQAREELDKALAFIAGCRVLLD